MQAPSRAIKRGIDVDLRLLLQGLRGTLEPRMKAQHDQSRLSTILLQYLKNPHAHWEMTEGLAGL